MKRILVAIFISILTSLYIFPFNTIWLPFVNTKMALAALGLVLFFWKGFESRDAQLSLPMFNLSISALIVSLVGLVAVFYNNTTDYAYASYFVSMWVWLGGAYALVRVINLAYGKVTVRIVGNFFIAVAVAQCFLAQIINANQLVSNWVDSFMVSTGFMGKVEDRLYGIGCALDVAGMKFCAVLILIAFFSVCSIPKKRQGLARILYISAFFIVSIWGSMISRTTSIGIILAIFLWVVLWIKYSNGTLEYTNLMKVIKTFTIFILVFSPIIVYLYYTDDIFQQNLRFGFEGFFSLLEEGEWDVKSNRQMVSMIVWPDNFKTWLIGDGYFENPMNDPNYLGPLYNYYMGTDVGYCRFVFYFGLLGLLAFSAFFVVSAFICSKNNPKYSIVFWLFLLMNFMAWIKVSSDLFSVFALFLFITSKSETSEFQQYKVKES